MQGIVGKLVEARSSKSLDSYLILAKFVSKSTLAKVIMPLKEVLRDCPPSATYQRKINGHLTVDDQGPV